MPPGVTTVTTPVPDTDVSVAGSATVRVDVVAAVTVSVTGMPPGGVNVTRVSGEKLLPVSTREAAVDTATAEGVRLVIVGGGGTIVYGTVTLVEPTITANWAKPGTVSAAFGSVTTCAAAVSEVTVTTASGNDAD